MKTFDVQPHTREYGLWDIHGRAADRRRQAPFDFAQDKPFGSAQDKPPPTAENAKRRLAAALHRAKRALRLLRAGGVIRYAVAGEADGGERLVVDDFGGDEDVGALARVGHRNR